MHRRLRALLMQPLRQFRWLALPSCHSEPGSPTHADCACVGVGGRAARFARFTSGIACKSGATAETRNLVLKRNVGFSSPAAAPARLYTPRCAVNPRTPEIRCRSKK